MLCIVLLHAPRGFSFALVGRRPMSTGSESLRYREFMHILIVHGQVKPDYLDQFVALTKINASESAKEPGVAQFDFLQQEDDPTRFVLFEVYRDKEAPVKHKETAHYL